MKIERILYRGTHLLGPEQFPCMLFAWPSQRRILPVWVDAQAEELLREAAVFGVSRPRRPRATDLFVDALEQNGGQVKFVALSSAHNGIFHADIVDWDGQEIDARPSDAVQIAIATDTPIYATEEILAQFSVYATEQECAEFFGISLEELAPTEEELAKPGGEELREAMATGGGTVQETSASGDAEADAMFAELMGSLGVQEADFDLSNIDQADAEGEADGEDSGDGGSADGFDDGFDDGFGDGRVPPEGR